MLQECYFLLEFLWEARKTILRHYILLFIGSYGLSFIIVELGTCRFCNNLCRVVEEDSCREIGQQIPKTIFWRIINPFCDPYLCCLIYWCSSLIWGLWSLHLCFMINFDWLSSCYLCSCRCSFLANSLNIFWWCRSNWNWRNYLFLLNNTSLIWNLWHFILIIVVTLSIVHLTTICKTNCLSWCSWSLSTIHSSSTSTNISWGCCFKSPW